MIFRNRTRLWIIWREQSGNHWALRSKRNCCAFHTGDTWLLFTPHVSLEKLTSNRLSQYSSFSYVTATITRYSVFFPGSQSATIMPLHQSLEISWTDSQRMRCYKVQNWMHVKPPFQVRKKLGVWRLFDWLLGLISLSGLTSRFKWTMANNGCSAYLRLTSILD